jgi:putative colanic acid biosynthesis UDP-glucose lipid carrier transferase
MSGLIKAIFFIGDLILLNISVIFAFEITTGSWVVITSNSIYLLIFSNLSWIYLITISSPYDLNKGWSMSRLIRSQLAFILVHLLVVASLIFFFKLDYSVTQIGLIYILFVPFFFGSKIIAYYFRKVFTPEVLHKNYVLIGRNTISNEVRRYYLLNAPLGYRFKGYLELDGSDSNIDKIRLFCNTNEVHEIHCCVPDMNKTVLHSLVNFGLDSLIKVKITIDSPGIQQQSIQFDKYDPGPGQDLLSIIPLDESLHQFIKRVFDVLFSSVFLIFIMSWLAPIIAILIKMESRGPVFFLQLRSGKDNKAFNCLKFRTMIVNQDADDIQATKNDPRITKFGNFLRKTSIDELPQFINVFIGTMSVVGPRPHMLKHTAEYGKLIEKFMGRHYVKPGITGLAQCLGYRGETKNIEDMKNRVRMDRYYIENWSFWLDLKIIFLTIVSLLRGSDKAF